MAIQLVVNKVDGEFALFKLRNSGNFPALGTVLDEGKAIAIQQTKPDIRGRMT